MPTEDARRKPEMPFDVLLADGLHALPFDDAWRDGDHADPHTDIGYAVVSDPYKYMPSYQEVARRRAEATGTDDWKALIKDNVVVTDRRSGMVICLRAAVSHREAVVSWFVRTGASHDMSVLCHDRTQDAHGFYVESMLSECTVWCDADGREVASEDESTGFSYRIDLHPRSIMIYGE